MRSRSICEVWSWKSLPTQTTRQSIAINDLRERRASAIAHAFTAHRVAVHGIRGSRGLGSFGIHHITHFRLQIAGREWLWEVSDVGVLHIAAHDHVIGVA